MSKTDKTPTAAKPVSESSTAKPSRLDQLQLLLSEGTGATIAEMMQVTGWQAHSIRGAMAGALKKRGLTITSEKLDSLRRYRVSMPK